MMEGFFSNQGNLALLLTGLIGVVFTIYGTALFLKAEASLDWPTTRGEVMVSELDVDNDRDGVTFRAEICYRYVLPSGEYVSNRVFFGHQISTSSSVAAAKVKNRYRVGQSVAVHYDPANESESVLEPGVNGLVKVVLIIGTALMVIA
ncbi:MAG: DUF3592 domain-containing protein, partial [Ferruginibacter sp.]|nr:DUF3592 domain-containing protein [Cytophagales bacterium]